MRPFIRPEELESQQVYDFIDCDLAYTCDRCGRDQDGPGMCGMCECQCDDERWFE